MKICCFCDNFREFLHIRCILPKLVKFFYDNMWQSAAHYRSKKGNRKWFQRCSSSKACSELTHLVQSHNRVSINGLICYLTLRLASVTGLSTWTHNACRQTNFFHTVVMLRCAIEKKQIAWNACLSAIWAEDSKMLLAHRGSTLPAREPGHGAVGGSRVVNRPHFEARTRPEPKITSSI